MYRNWIFHEHNLSKIVLLEHNFEQNRSFQRAMPSGKISIFFEHNVPKPGAIRAKNSIFPRANTVTVKNSDNNLVSGRAEFKVSDEIVVVYHLQKIPIMENVHVPFLHTERLRSWTKMGQGTWARAEKRGTCKWNKAIHSKRSNRENRTTFSDDSYISGVFQLDEPQKRFPFYIPTEICGIF